MPAHGERQHDVAGVLDAEGLLERGRPRERVGHAQTEGIGEDLARLGRIGELEGHGIRRLLGDAVRVVARQAVTAERNRPLGRGRLIVADRAHDGEQDRRLAVPPARVALPQILGAVQRKAGELRALGVDGGGERARSEGDGCHGEPLSNGVDADCCCGHYRTRALRSPRQRPAAPPTADRPLTPPARSARWRGRTSHPDARARPLPSRRASPPRTSRWLSPRRARRGPARTR